MLRAPSGATDSSRCRTCRWDVVISRRLLLRVLCGQGKIKPSAAFGRNQTRCGQRPRWVEAFKATQDTGKFVLVAANSRPAPHQPFLVHNAFPQASPPARQLNYPTSQSAESRFPESLRCASARVCALNLHELTCILCPCWRWFSVKVSVRTVADPSCPRTCIG
jgi:hypothetical protein